MSQKTYIIERMQGTIDDVLYQNKKYKQLAADWAKRAVRAEALLAAKDRPVLLSIPTLIGK